MWDGQPIKHSRPQCDKGARVRLSCYHDLDRVIQVACGKVGECVECMNAWRGKVRRRIFEGCRQGNLWFFTVTFMADVSLDEGMRRWRLLWKELSRRGLGLRMFRVVELTEREARDGGKVPHFHAVIDGPMPAILKAQKWTNGHRGEPIGHYIDRQDQEARAFIWEVLIPHGFGIIAHCERVRLGGKGASSYLGKYLSKSKVKSLVRQDGRRVRVAEGSRNWLVDPPVPTFRYGTVRVAVTRTVTPSGRVVVVEDECHDARCRCSVPRRKMLQPEGKAVDDAAKLVWRSRLQGLEEEASLYRDAAMAAQRAYSKRGADLEAAKDRKRFCRDRLRMHGYNGPLALVVADRRGQAAIYDRRRMELKVASLVSEIEWAKFGKWMEEKPWLLVTPTQSELFDISAVEALMRTRPSRLLSSPISRGNGSETYAVTLLRRRGRFRSLTNPRRSTGT